MGGDDGRGPLATVAESFDYSPEPLQDNSLGVSDAIDDRPPMPPDLYRQAPQDHRTLFEGMAVLGPLMQRIGQPLGARTRQTLGCAP